MKLSLQVKYSETYPDVLPELSLHVLDGALHDLELASLMSGLQAVGEENINTAMTFTLISHLREKLLELLHFRADRRRREATEQERLLIEVCSFISKRFIILPYFSG